MSNSIIYLHGRPSSHPLHNSLAKSITQESNFIDYDYRWQDLGFNYVKSFFLQVLNAFQYSKYKKYEILLIDGLHPTPIIAKKIGLLHPNAKIYAHMGSHTLYFIYAKKYNYFNLLFYKYLLKSYDGFLCEGKMASDLIDKIIPNNEINKVVTFLGPLDEKIPQLQNIEPDIESFNIVTIADGSSNFRIYYKGLDLMIESFVLAKKNFPKLKFFILGHWDQGAQAYLLKGISDNNIKNDIVFVGRTDDIYSYLKKSTLYLHISRGDAFPTSTIEAMTAGLPVFLSEWTGTKEIIEHSFPQMICNLKPKDITKKIEWYFALGFVQKKEISEKMKIVSKSFCESSAKNHYSKSFKTLHEKE